jgi:hypothetical protein
MEALIDFVLDGSAAARRGGMDGRIDVAAVDLS